MPTTSKEMVLGKVPKIDERKIGCCNIERYRQLYPKYLANQEPITTPFFEKYYPSDPLFIYWEE